MTILSSRKSIMQPPKGLKFEERPWDRKRIMVAAIRFSRHKRTEPSQTVALQADEQKNGENYVDTRRPAQSS